MLTILAITTSKSLQSPTNILLGSLAAADITTILVALPTRVSICEECALKNGSFVYLLDETTEH